MSFISGALILLHINYSRNDVIRLLWWSCSGGTLLMLASSQIISLLHSLVYWGFSGETLSQVSFMLFSPHHVSLIAN